MAAARQIKYKGKIYTGKILAEIAERSTRWGSELLRDVERGTLTIQEVLSIVKIGKRPIPNRKPLPTYTHIDDSGEKTVYTVEMIMKKTGLAKRQAKNRIYNVREGYSKVGSLLKPSLWKEKREKALKQKKTGRYSYLSDKMTPERKEAQETLRLASIGLINQNEFLRG